MVHRGVGLIEVDPVAQLEEQRPSKPQVAGSSPAGVISGEARRRDSGDEVGDTCNRPSHICRVLLECSSSFASAICSRCSLCLLRLDDQSQTAPDDQRIRILSTSRRDIQLLVSSAGSIESVGLCTDTFYSNHKRANWSDACHRPASVSHIERTCALAYYFDNSTRGILIFNVYTRHCLKTVV